MENDNRNGAADAVPLPERIMSPVVWICGAISAALILVQLGVTSYAIFMRYVFNKPLVWGDQFLGYMLVAFVMLGATEAYRQNNHISIDMIADKLTGPWQVIRWMWSDLCVLAFATVVAVSAWEAISFARLFGSYSAGAIEIQTWIPQVPVLLGAILMAAFALARLVGRLVRRN